MAKNLANTTKKNPPLHSIYVYLRENNMVQCLEKSLCTFFDQSANIYDLNEIPTNI